MNALKTVSCWIDTLNEWVGRGVAWVTAGLVMVVFVDVLMRMGSLTRRDYDAWRFGRTSCLERVITVNLAKVNHLLRAFQQHAQAGGLRPSKTVYLSWGKGKKRQLRFSKSGMQNIEESYATHFLKPREGK